MLMRRQLLIQLTLRLLVYAVIQMGFGCLVSQGNLVGVVSLKLKFMLFILVCD
ncbi:hypothetical protein REPUB_Repub03eG0168600 [Reevesia pubescens]